MNKPIIGNEFFRVVKVVDFKVYVEGGYELLSGWGIEYAKDGGLLSSADGERPYLLKTRANAAEYVKDGLYAPIKTVH
ncbi:hypothetical protein [Metapseudomonas otitidis]|uniref:hypothetical protein n=1 Tax=Metapseudomonas otitidis TaxID=319939 RepID=UPI00366FDD3C